MRKLETVGLSMVRNHRIAASKGISRGESCQIHDGVSDGVEFDLINWPLTA